MTTLVTFVSGPGTGKSTTSALAFGWLKAHQFSAEMAREYAKKWAWQKRSISGIDEFYLTGKQIHEEAQYLGKVDYVVSDKPVLMDVYYARKYASPTVARGVEAMVRAYYEADELAARGGLATCCRLPMGMCQCSAEKRTEGWRQWFDSITPPTR